MLSHVLLGVMQILPLLASSGSCSGSLRQIQVSSSQMPGSNAWALSESQCFLDDRCMTGVSVKSAGKGEGTTFVLSWHFSVSATLFAQRILPYSAKSPHSTSSKLDDASVAGHCSSIIVSKSSSEICITTNSITACFRMAFGQLACLLVDAICKR